MKSAGKRCSGKLISVMCLEVSVISVQFLYGRMCIGGEEVGCDCALVFYFIECCPLKSKFEAGGLKHRQQKYTRTVSMNLETDKVRTGK